ncbi:MAG: LysM domain-containing protein [Pseudomonadales bacterium]|nr:LysM domain-containing protein [Pseudomonadales bacterium]MDP6471438.1 LysM domain-containing protein [Pseudomonadales bacterium]MDP6828607.1 LysM domain-containing protein [Pseudomonadales bacterium]MDP6973210.1 LysM domain-containing protein [Pseudomonadales bacterium]
MRKPFCVRHLFCTLVLALGTMGVQAADLAQYLKPGHPEVYTVVKGDTLWGISGRFLKRPWLWPEIWQVNPQIENPHLIYPGDRISLVYVQGQPRLALTRGDAGRTVRMSPSNDVKLSPQIRVSPLDSAIPTIGLDALRGFLVQNRIVEPSWLITSPYVVEGASERIVLGAGDRLYVRGELMDERSYSIVRRGPIYVDPVTEEVLGQEATHIGLGTASAQDGEIATMEVSSTREEIKIGDRVMPTEERRVQSTFFPSAPDEEIRGEIISVFGGVTQVGTYDVVVLNRGEREGLENGNVLATYRKGALARDRIAGDTIRLPSERAGLLMVFRVFEKLSYGLILESEQALAVGDEIRNP